ncbi:hypothetical protein OROHE_001157 [Orobanche hederae]
MAGFDLNESRLVFEAGESSTAAARSPAVSEEHPTVVEEMAAWLETDVSTGTEIAHEETAEDAVRAGIHLAEVEALFNEADIAREEAGERPSVKPRGRFHWFHEIFTHFVSLGSITRTRVSYFAALGPIPVRVPVSVLPRLVAKTSQLESDKVQKEGEVQKLMEENVRLSALLDKKEAQLVAMNEQCKVMALNSSNI